MKKEYTPDDFKFEKDLDGRSVKMLTEHLKLYQGYVKKSNEIQEKIRLADKAEANASYSYIGELKRQETFSINGMKLHEVYFGHLGGNGKPGGELLKMIESDFESYEQWQEDMVSTGIAARGWGILAYDYRDNRLHTYGTDAHNIAVWGAVPLIALDVYEHAYMIDYGVNRKDYINSFFKNLNWEFANKLVHHYDLAKRHEG
jgi:Fe-Mn family superoxide dismutase